MSVGEPVYGRVGNHDSTGFWYGRRRRLQLDERRGEGCGSNNFGGGGKVSNWFLFTSLPWETREARWCIMQDLPS